MKLCDYKDCTNEAKWGIVFEEDAARDSMLVCDEHKKEMQLLHKDTPDKSIIAVFELH